jgi:arylsulfatase A-like enzyme
MTGFRLTGSSFSVVSVASCSISPATLLQTLLLSIAVVAFAASPASETQADEVRPNILWLSTEDIGPHLGCYGDPAAKTPNLDRFAKMGTLYETAWSNYPVCAPARTTIITGVYPASTGTGHMRCSRPLPEKIRLFPQYLRDAGYYCTNNSKEDYNCPKPGNVWDESSRKAHYKNRKDGQPFFAVFNYTGTHESRIRSKPHTVKTDVSKIELPKYYPDIPEVRRDWGQYYDNIATMDGWFARQLDELKQSGEWDNTIILFWGDHGSGMPRHKRYPGDSGQKVPFIVHVPEKLRVHAPKDYQPGARSKRLVGFIDLAPTTLSIAGIKPPDFMHGHAFLGKSAVDGPEYLYGFRDRMDERPDLARSLRDQRYLYIRNYMPYRPHGQHVWYQFETTTTAKWKELHDAGKLNDAQTRFWQTPRDPEELYDLQADPDEVQNLAGDAKHRQTLDRFRKEHRRKTLEIRDVSFMPESLVEITSRNRPPYETARDEEAYPLERILDVADRATHRDAESLPSLVKSLASNDPTIVYWSATGIFNRGKDAVQKHRNELRGLLTDNGQSAVVAAEALARYTDGDDRADAVKALGRLANLKHSDYFTAVAALNAIDALGDVARPTHAGLKKIPAKQPGVKRATTYIQRLVETIAGE